jgi:two-component system phosphate regulon response regulator PhoB
MREPNTAGPSGGRVLVLDDDDQVRRLLCVALEVAGFDALEAGSAYDAYRCLVSDSRLDALVIDLTEADPHGLDVLRSVRARADLQDLPIVFLATLTQTDLKWRAHVNGADAFFVKPLSLRELQITVGTLVSESRPTALRR